MQRPTMKVYALVDPAKTEFSINIEDFDEKKFVDLSKPMPVKDDLKDGETIPAVGGATYSEALRTSVVLGVNEAIFEPIAEKLMVPAINKSSPLPLKRRRSEGA